MKYLLAYMFFAYFVGMRAATKDVPLKSWPLLVMAFVVGAGFLSLRVING